MTEKESKQVKMEDVQAKADEKKCPVQKSLVFIEEFLAGPMCGRCFPCSMGIYEARIRTARIVEGTAADEDIETIKKISSHMQVASMCKKGKDTAKYLLEQIDSNEFADHISGVCSSNECIEQIKYIIIPENCTMCGDCLDACRDNAIIGEKKKAYLSGYMPFEIVQKRCTKCGECMKVCKHGAVRLISAKEMAEAETVGA
ncbi:MAG TPA: 4Fe-4S dicluster domain-containing protein [Nitrospirae bacterium]|nr:NADP-reducing hydrogenase subunit HndC [bacterium BMS3Abin06]HDH12227.1 4Fe-4S dicluster domain-containing protein [Nitrospirota bacterium]HDZ01103.1 4Fe-4S dicluster domain-containing protein [Nitrospirota bacterium]